MKYFRPQNISNIKPESPSLCGHFIQHSQSWREQTTLENIAPCEFLIYNKYFSFSSFNLMLHLKIKIYFPFTVLLNFPFLMLFDTSIFLVIFLLRFQLIRIFFFILNLTPFKIWSLHWLRKTMTDLFID